MWWFRSSFSDGDSDIDSDSETDSDGDVLERYVDEDVADLLLRVAPLPNSAALGHCLRDEGTQGLLK